MNRDEKDTDMLADYMAGRLSADETAALDARLESDEELHAQLVTLQAARRDLADQVAAETGHEFAWARLEKALDEEALPVSLRRQIYVLRAVAALFALLLIGQAAWYSTQSRPLNPAVYETASSDTSYTFVLRIAFAPDTPVSDVTSLIRNIDATVIGGPTALGLYSLEFKDEAALQSALEQLKSNDWIMSVTR